MGEGGQGVVLGVMRSRRSVRRYKANPVSMERIVKVLEAGSYAPSGANQQPWIYIVVDDDGVKEEIRRKAEEADRAFHREAPDWLRGWLREQGITTTKSFLTDAPFLIVVAAYTKAPYWLESTWISIAYIILVAEDMGLASLTYTPGDTAFLNGLLRLPQDHRAVAILPVGYPDEEPSPRERPRKPLEQTAFHNWYGVKLPDPSHQGSY